MQHKEDSDDDGHSVRRAPVSGPRDCWLACRLGAYGGLQLVRVTSCFVGALAQGDEEDETDIKFDADQRMQRKLTAMTAKDAEKRVRWVIQVRVAGSQPMCFGGHRSLCSCDRSCKTRETAAPATGTKRDYFSSRLRGLTSARALCVLRACAGTGGRQGEDVRRD